MYVPSQGQLQTRRSVDTGNYSVDEISDWGTEYFQQPNENRMSTEV
jgi:hypothetical protein